MSWTFQISPKLYYFKKKGKLTPLTVKKWIFKKKKSYFLMVKGHINPKITSLGEKLWPVAWILFLLEIYKEKKRKMSIKSVKMKISKKNYLSHVPRIIQPKNLVPRPKGVLCSLVTDRQTHEHENDYCGHPFRISGVFPSTYHQVTAPKLTR